MQVYTQLEDFVKGNFSVATIGTFDGVHLGHQKILLTIQDIARENQGETVLISFHPHPRQVLFPQAHGLQLLQTLDEKIETLRKLGIDKLMLIPFTKAFATMDSTQFIEEVLVERMGVKRLVIGYDHHFGKNRSGNIDELRQLAPKYGYEVEEIPAQAIDEANVSSTKIRNALLEGDIATANGFLGYPYSFTGKVVHGQKQGRLLGYPTANIEVSDASKLIPANGIYCVKVAYLNQILYGMMSIGHKPTMGVFGRSIEVNIFDFSQDIYGQDLTISLLCYIRPEKKFNDWDELIEAIAGDKAFCIQFLHEYLK